MASSNLDVLPSPPQPSRIGGGSIAADRGNSDLSRVDRGNVVALVGYTKNKIGSNPIANSSILPQVSQREHGGTLQYRSTLHFSYKSILESCSNNPDFLNQEDLDLLSKYLRTQTRETYGPGLHHFQGFCKGYNVIHLVASLPLIVKFICHLYNIGVFHKVMASAIAAISKYQITDKTSGINMGKHPLVTTAKKIFCQQRPPLPRYHGTDDIRIVLRFIEKETLSLKQLSFKTAS